MACETRWIRLTDADHLDLDGLSDQGLFDLMGFAAIALAHRGHAIEGVELAEANSKGGDRK